MDEQWRNVPGYAGRYSVSDRGRVRSDLRGRMLKPSCQTRGYLSVVLYDGSSPKRPKSHCVHRIVAEAFHGPCPDGMTVDHVNGDKLDNRPNNLQYVTVKENNRRYRQHHPTVGENNPRAKLTADEVRAIRDLAPKWTIQRLSRFFGVSTTQIRHIIHGMNWSHI